MTKYQYDGLPEDNKPVRLLSLGPGDLAEEVCVELIPALLTGLTPSYEALSYVWGSPKDPVPVVVGRARKHNLMVTQNLGSALRGLRHRNVPRVLWVDAICINQSDTAERSSQVAIMGDIYCLATRVVIWLGNEGNDSASALGCLESIGLSVKVDWIDYSIWPNVLADGDELELPDLSIIFHHGGRLVNALYHLFQREWFERLWIRQEIGLAKNAVIGCGDKSIQWETFRSAIFYVYTAVAKYRSELLESLHNRDSMFINRLKLLYTVCDHKTYLLDCLRAEISQVKCTDPRDRIYASLSLLHPAHQAMGIVPDYTLTTSQVYKKAVLSFINHWNSLAILFQCELRDGPITTPTWVPDWSTATLANAISGAPSNASAYFEAIIKYRGDGILNAAGVVVATIMEVRPIHIDNCESFEDILRSLWNTLKSEGANDAKSPRNDRRRQLETFRDTICCGLFGHTTIPERDDLADFETSVRLMAVLLGLEYRVSSEELGAQDAKTWEKYVSRAKEVCQNRSFFTTSQGLIGLAPIAAHAGDEVCVLLGCDSTILLRPINDYLHQVVGQSYMSGINTGEALLGPLPGNLRAVNYYDSTAQAFYYAYFNKQSRKIEFRDPRLYTLSMDLSYHEQLWEKGGFQRIKIELDVLRGSNIDVKTFDLV
ncbi:hypothetical protein WAI453_000596 [Rhynchosporium graminicola]